MSATITRGATFTLAQQNIDVATFKPLLTSATIANIDRDNMKIADNTAVTRQATALSNPQTKELWQDTQNNFIAVYLNAAWAPALSFGRAFTLSATSAAVVAGDVLMVSISAFDAAGTLTKALGTQKYSAVAVACTDVSPGGTGLAIFHGPAQARSTGTINFGEAVQVSGTDGVLQSAAAAGLGYGPFVIGAALQAASGGYAWIHLRR